MVVFVKILPTRTQYFNITLDRSDFLYGFVFTELAQVMQHMRVRVTHRMGGNETCNALKTAITELQIRVISLTSCCHAEHRENTAPLV